MTSERIKEIQEQTAYPESVSVMLALKQVWNECEQEQLAIQRVSQRSELLFALLDWIDYGNKEDKEHIIDTFLKDIHSK
jgi:hypothetical protein